jgi:hypothetical protein
MDPRVGLCHTQLLIEGTVCATWPWEQSHLGLSSPERLDLPVEKHLQEVHPCEPLLPQLLKGLTHMLQLSEVLPSHPIPRGREGNGAATGKHGERRKGVVPHVKPFFATPFVNMGMGMSKYGLTPCLDLT